MEATPDGGAIVVGQIRIAAPDNFADALIAKLDQNGNVVWSIALDGLWSQFISDIERLNDGNYVLTGGYGDNSGYRFMILKITENGTLLWRKENTIAHPGEAFGRNIIKEAADGSFMVASQFRQGGLSFSDRLLLLKINSTGDILYSKFYTPAATLSIMHINDIVIKDNYSYIAGSHLFPSQNNQKAWVIKTEIASGNVTWSKSYDFNNGPSEFWSIFPTSNNQLCLFGTDDMNARDTNIIYRIDTAGNVLSSKYFQFNTGISGQGQAATYASNGDIIFSKMYYRTPYNNSTLTLSRVNPENGIIYSRDFPGINLGPRALQTRVSSDNSILVIGNKNLPNGTFPSYLSRFSPQGNSGCSHVDIPATFGNGICTPVNFPVTIGDKTYPAFSSGTINPVVFTPVDSICIVANLCDTVKIHGQTLICDIQPYYDFTAYRNPACVTAVNWQIDPAAIQSFQQVNDTTARFRFNANWQGYLYAKIEYPCGLYTDSIRLSVFNSPGPINLGPDADLCPNNSKLLNARSGYASYRWQDGSTDSTFLVTAPGLYWVDVYDMCNNTTFTDSIHITPAPPVQLDIGPDLMKCNSDSVLLTAPSGFLNYQWGPNYNISNLLGQSVYVFPSIDTIYYLKAEKTPGCFGLDTVRISVNQSVPISLGIDKSICKGDSLHLDAGSGFTGYNWNTGATSQQIVVRTQGEYRVIAWAPNGCESKDTIRLTQVYDLPVTDLGPDTFICEQSSKTFDAGPGFQNYLWNTGSTNRSISATNPGLYYVEVTDLNSCKGYDSVRISGFWPVPTSFLSKDTALCSYSTISIQPVSSFNAYYWNTGATTPSIQVKNPGLYWLEVRTENNCTAIDSILVTPKQCLNGFYIPNAFTPNNDGRNDIFRPLIFGQVEVYEFSIYNRWGERIYFTKSLQDGWDGKVSFTKTDSHAFIWVCKYKLSGEPEMLKKGTFVLIR